MAALLAVMPLLVLAGGGVGVGGDGGFGFGGDGGGGDGAGGDGGGGDGDGGAGGDGGGVGGGGIAGGRGGGGESAGVTSVKPLPLLSPILQWRGRRPLQRTPQRPYTPLLPAQLACRGQHAAATAAIHVLQRP